MSRQILCLNTISDRGLSLLRQRGFVVGEEVPEPEGIILRSYRLSMDRIPGSVKAVARAGAGVNNIDVDGCTRRGVPVFNTPGANANAVKELVLAALLLCSRGILPGIQYLQSLAGIKDLGELTKRMEAEKKQFKGVDLHGRSIGVVGLGAVGARVADVALTMGMRVYGYDPALSIESAWRLSSGVERCESLSQLVRRSDYISLHVPATENTLSLVDQNLLEQFRDGACLLNFSRAEVVNVADICDALAAKKLKAYASDFPHPDLIGLEGVILMPHIGASTVEAEENCALMAAEQLCNFLLSGNIMHSVNYPSISLEQCGSHRLVLSNRNVPKMLNSVLEILGNADINVVELLNKSRGEVAYNLIDIDRAPEPACVDQICAIEGIIGVRVIDNQHLRSAA